MSIISGKKNRRNNCKEPFHNKRKGLFYFYIKILNTFLNLLRYYYCNRQEVENINSKDNFIRMIEQYQNLVFSICLKMTGDYFAAEDLAQETFIAAYKHLDEFDGKSESAWLCRIASNKCIDYHRASARKMIPTPEEEIPEGKLKVEDTMFRTVTNRQVMDELRRCCEELLPPYKDVALMHFLEGRTAKEISELTGVGMNTVQTRIYRAREKLKISYRKELLEE